MPGLEAEIGIVRRDQASRRCTARLADIVNERSAVLKEYEAGYPEGSALVGIV